MGATSSASSGCFAFMRESVRSAAALTVYDMCKAVQRDMVITDVRLLYKDGGKSGTYEVK